MTSVCEAEVENTIERFSHISSTSTKSLLSRIARTSAYDSVVQEDRGVLNISTLIRSSRIAVAMRDSSRRFSELGGSEISQL